MIKRFLSVFLLGMLCCLFVAENGYSSRAVSQSDDAEYIKWVDFDVSYQALHDALMLDIETYEQDLHIGWIESLAYLGTIYGGDFSRYQKKDLNDLAEKRQNGSSMDDLTAKYAHYDYYFEAYSAVLDGLAGLRDDGTYGLTAYSPIAAGYWYTESDDFGNGRSYGFARKHLGHDMFCSTGTPVAAVEDGIVEALGWNQYGGWRIGIRSGDGRRYYYYAHLRKDVPYAENLAVGDKVKAGQIIGYSGQTGYSLKENVNNINVPHLHFGLQLIFDESQKECNSEIWIDVYPLVRLLAKNRATPDAAVPAAAKAEPTAESVQVPILMYHGLTTKASQVNDYFIPVDTFEADLQYLKANGYTSVTMSDLIAFVYDKTGKVSLPEKPVVLTFDDGFYNNYKYASPLLSEYGMNAVISLIGEACEKESATDYHAEDYCEVTWDQIQAMSDSGLWEIQNHTWNLHENNMERKGASRSEGEDQKAYETMLTADLKKLQTKLTDITGKTPNTFTWPYGAHTEDNRKILTDLGFQATLSCRSGVNTITKGDGEGLFLLKRNLRKPNTAIESLLK